MPRAVALERQRSGTQHLQWIAAGESRILVEQIVGPAMVIVDAVSATTIPVKRGSSSAGIADIHCARDLSVAAALVIEHGVADHQYEAVPSEVSVHGQVSGYDQHPVAGGVTAERQVAVHHNCLQVRR